MLITDAIALLTQHIEAGTVHQDYKRVCDLADKYEALITGEDAGKLLKQFVKREDKAAFDQRVELTQAITPSVSNSIQQPYNKVTRNRKVIKKLELESDATRLAVERMITDFYGDEADNKGLDYWLQTRFVDLSFLDPNSFLVIEFGPFDYRYEKPTPRPFEVTAKEAINFLYVNNDLKWLEVRQDITYVEGANTSTKGTTKKGYRFTFYDTDGTVVMERVGKDYAPQPGERIIEVKKDKEYYKLVTFLPNFGFCAAFRIGYIPDKKTRARTYVNPFHAALPYFMKTVKTVSEMDLSMSLHAFPQKMQYVRDCKGTDSRKCIDGCDPQGNTCSTCGGLGFVVHTSAQDALYYKMPRDKQDMLPLNELLVYKSPPIDLLTFQDQYIDKLELKCHRTIFNSDVYVRPDNQVAKTATEKNLEMESIYDTLGPFAQRISSLYVFAVYSFTVLADGDPKAGTIQHIYPVDLKMENLTTLLDKVKTANDSQAPSFVTDAVSNDLAELIYADDEIGLLKYRTKQAFYPFAGKSAAEVTFLLSSDLVTDFDKVLYAYYERIYSEIERDMGNQDFYRWQRTKQWPEIEKRTNAYLQKQQVAKAGAMADAFNASRGTGGTAAAGGSADNTDKGGAAAADDTAVAA